MGSTARRGGDGVRYCGGRSPRGIIKDAALIIFGRFRRASGAEMGWWEKVEGATTKCDFAAKWVQSGDVGPHGLARGRRRGKECHSWWQDMRTQGREMNSDARVTIEDGRRRWPTRETRSVAAERVEGVLSVEAAGRQRRRGSRAATRGGRKEIGSNSIQSAGVDSCKLDDERGVCEWMEAFPGGLGRSEEGRTERGRRGGKVGREAVRKVCTRNQLLRQEGVS